MHAQALKQGLHMLTTSLNVHFSVVIKSQDKLFLENKGSKLLVSHFIIMKINFFVHRFVIHPVYTNSTKHPTGSNSISYYI